MAAGYQIHGTEHISEKLKGIGITRIGHENVHLTVRNILISIIPPAQYKTVDFSETTWSLVGLSTGAGSTFDKMHVIITRMPTDLGRFAAKATLGHINNRLTLTIGELTRETP